MSAVTDQLERPMKVGRQAVDRTFHLVEKQVTPALSNRRVQIAMGVLLAAAVALGAGMLAYRRRRRRTLGSRIQGVLPEELVARTGAIKRSFGQSSGSATTVGRFYTTANEVLEPLLSR